MHTIRRRFKSSNVRWFKIMKTTKQLHIFYQTALILCSELENTLYYTCTSSIVHEQYLFSQVFFLLLIQIRSTVLLTIKSKDQI